MVSVIIPAYNEEDAIGNTVKAVQATLKTSGVEKYEVIAVDDGSTDDTAQRARSSGAKVISNPHNIGYGRSLKIGISAAAYDTIVIVDADGTYPIEMIPKLLEEYRKGFDMVVGNRTGAEYRESWFKYPLRLFLKFLVEFTVGRKIPDVNSGFRIFSKSTIMPYFNHLSDMFSFTTSSTMAYMLTGKFVKYIPIPYHKRQGCTKVRLFQDSLRMLQFIVQAILYYNPIKLFLVVSTAPILISIISLVVAVALSSRMMFTIGIQAAMMAILIFSIGLVADMLRQIMRNTR